MWGKTIGKSILELITISKNNYVLFIKEFKRAGIKHSLWIIFFFFFGPLSHFICTYVLHSYKKNSGVPIVAQRKRIQLGTVKLRDQSLAFLSGLSIRRCRELWCRPQMRLRSSIAVAMAVA